MMKVKVDWHQHCPSCDTEIVVDLLSLGAGPTNCPWCGASVPGPLGSGSEALRQEVLQAVANLEEQLASKLDRSGAPK